MSLRTVLLLCFSILALHSRTCLVTSNTICPAGFTRISSVNGCYTVVIDNLPWSLASLRCHSLHKDAHLLVINTGEEQAAIASLLQFNRGRCDYLPQAAFCPVEVQDETHGKCNDEFFWTAGQRSDPSRRSSFIWRATTSTKYIEMSMAYTNWDPGQPDAGPEQSCVQIWARNSYTWDDYYCDRPICSVCEINSTHTSVHLQWTMNDVNVSLSIDE